MYTSKNSNYCGFSATDQIGNATISELIESEKYEKMKCCGFLTFSCHFLFFFRIRIIEWNAKGNAANKLTLDSVGFFLLLLDKYENAMLINCIYVCLL